MSVPSPMPDPDSARVLGRGAQPAAYFPDTEVAPGAGENETVPVAGLANGWHPRTDVVEYPEYYLLLIDAPGAQSDRVEITLTSGILTVFIRRPENAWPENALLHRGERDFGNAFRSFQAPPDAADEFSTNVSNGVVTVRVPRRLGMQSPLDLPGKEGGPGGATPLPEATESTDLQSEGDLEPVS